MSIEICSTVGDYHLVELIGRGGMGKICACRIHHKLGLLDHFVSSMLLKKLSSNVARDAHSRSEHQDQHKIDFARIRMPASPAGIAMNMDRRLYFGSHQYKA